ncbi:hypothetical protein D917_07279 [Trichinella nativa]|uniref:Uncharacterized protein n=1 Tax=Trichinella nativa TaxID=6335 RepID=A0A1Y3EP89_9BILA|nr:hypothetical protein D917_07279 [Trichinella nativa]
MACFCFLNCLFIIFQAIFYSSAPPNSLVCWSEDSPCHKKIKPRFEKLVVRFNSPPPGAPRKVRRPVTPPADDDAVQMLALMLKQRLAQAKRRRQLFHDDDEQTTSTNTVAVSESLQREIDAFLAHSEIDDLFATVDLSSLEFSYSQPSSSNAPTPYERYKASVSE